MFFSEGNRRSGGSGKDKKWEWDWKEGKEERLLVGYFYGRRMKEKNERGREKRKRQRDCKSQKRWMTIIKQCFPDTIEQSQKLLVVMTAC